MTIAYRIVGLLLLASAICVSAQEPPAPKPAAKTPAAGGSGSRPDDIFLDKRRGIAAYRKKDYGAAADFFARYYGNAYSKSVMVDAAELLLPALIATKRLDDGLRIVRELPARGEALSKPKIVDGSVVLDPLQWKLSPLETRRFGYWEGRLLLAKGDAANAIGPLGQGTAADVGQAMRADAHLWRALAYASLEKWSEAAADFDLAEQLAPDEASKVRARFGRIEALIRQKRFVEAEAIIKASWDTAPKERRTRLGVLNILTLLELKNLDAAWAVFSKRLGTATDLIDNPSHFLILRTLGNQLRNSKRPADAHLVFARLFPLTTDEALRRELLLDMAEAAAEAGKVEEAVKRLRQFLKLFPEDKRCPTIRYRIGEILEAKDPVAAVETYKAVGGNEKAPAALRYKSWMRIADLARREKVPGGPATAVDAYVKAGALTVPAADQGQALYQAAELTFHEIQDHRLAAERYQVVADRFPATQIAEESRLKQAQSLHRLKRYRQSAETYAQFRKEFPKSSRDSQALLEQATVLREGESLPEALRAFREFQKLYPETDEAPFALVQAAVCAEKIGYFGDALDALTGVIDKYATTRHYPEALYRRTYLHLSQGRSEQAVEDGTRFVTRFSTASDENRGRAAHVYLWLGDHYASEGRYKAAEETFGKLIEMLPDTADAPTALYEAAKCAWHQARANRDNRENLAQASAYLKILFDDYVTKKDMVPDRIYAQACFLRGDILSLGGNFGDAAEWFSRCMKLVPGSLLYWSAQGRLGECEYSLAAAAADGKELYTRALGRFQEIIDANSVPPAYVEMARYRAARIHEILGNPVAARREYQTIFYGETSRREVTTTNWFYYARSGYSLARLFLAENNRAQAIKVYRNMAEQKHLPIAKDAAAEADKLEKEYQP